MEYKCECGKPAKHYTANKYNQKYPLNLCDDCLEGMKLFYKEEEFEENEYVIELNVTRSLKKIIYFWEDNDEVKKDR